MCGIGAIIEGDVSSIRRLMLPIRSRGEIENFNENKKIGNTILSCNRLKIVGRKSGKQPLTNETDELFAVMNGEIYNHKSLRKELHSKGHRFKTRTDTEVLVHGYEEWGVGMLEKLEGQFSFVIYDSKDKHYFAARDHFGIKPLYIAKEEKTTYIASELKQLVGIAENIEEISPGHYVLNGKIRKYYSPSETQDHHGNDEAQDIPINEAVKTIRELFDKAVKKRIDTDLPIAVFLSGGIDSTAVLTTARKYHDKVAAIVVGNHWDSDDSDYQVAIRYCQENNIPVIARHPPSEEELFREIPEIIRISESFEPNVIKQTGLSLYLSKIAKEYSFKVVLCGEGADEIFCGYPEFRDVHESQVNKLSKEFLDSLYKTQLQRIDRTSMAHTIEVRVPFLDKDLVEYVLKLPANLKVRGRVTKWILRKAMEDRLPKYVTERKKIVLSEGMGLKGNSLKRGMFSEKIARIITEKELAESRKIFEKFRMDTPEEAFYMKIYDQLGYSKLRFSGRCRANNKPSIVSAEEIIKILSKKKFSRSAPKSMGEPITRSINANKPIKVVGFWGVGRKGEPDALEMETIRILRQLDERIKEVFEPGLEFTFIMADKHAEMNEVPKETIDRYVNSMTRILKNNGFKTISLSSIWNKHGISAGSIRRELKRRNAKWWENIPNKRSLLANASHVNPSIQPEESAKTYCIMRKIEKPILEDIFRGYIFQTFSNPETSYLLPRLPTIFLRAGKNWSNVPWFYDENQS